MDSALLVVIISSVVAVLAASIVAVNAKSLNKKYREKHEKRKSKLTKK